MISLQTNVDSISAQNNLNINNKFQGSAIQQLTSGFRINSSGDDAAGLAIANGYRDDIAELTQGVSNAGNGVNQLQIIDGGLSNISTVLDQLKTLATESASNTFTGSRATLNQEYQTLVSEITRQASNINLNAGGTFNNPLSVYIGGANSASNATVHVDLSGSTNAVDAQSLGLATTNVLGGGVSLSGDTQRLDAPGATFVTGTAGTNDETFTLNVFSNGNAQQVTAKVTASAGGSTLSQVLSQLNGELNQYGVTAGVNGSGLLQFSGASAFTASGDTTGVTNALISAAGTAENSSNYIVDGTGTFAAPSAAETLKFQTNNGAATVTIATTDTLQSTISKINAQTSSLGVYAVLNSAGTNISLQGASSFSVSDSGGGTANSIFGTAAGYYSGTAPVSSDSTNANAAITAINAAIQSLGLVQGRVGTGENTLQYAINLANSQITNLSASEGSIRDADVAKSAANLTKAQVLVQTSVAALAQANSEPQAVLKLLQNL